LYDIGGAFIHRLPFQSKYKLKVEDHGPFNPCDKYDGPNPLTLLEGIQHRLTSKAEDEFLCVASLMGLEAKQVARFSSRNERVGAFYRMLAGRHIPMSPQVLLSLEPKIAVEGFGWAPTTLSSLFRYGYNAFFYEQSHGRYFNSTGLYYKCPAYLLTMVKREPNDLC